MATTGPITITEVPEKWHKAIMSESARLGRKVTANKLWLDALEIGLIHQAHIKPKPQINE